jgi:hypothetical protein
MPDFQRRADLSLLGLPFVILRIVVWFAAPTLKDVLALRQVSKRFQHAVSSPSMVGQVRAKLYRVWEHAGLLGEYARGLQFVEATHVQNIKPLFSMPSVRHLILAKSTPDCQTLNDALAHLHHLESLNISCCPSVSTLAYLPPNLRELDVSYCRNLRALPDMLNLIHLNANNCTNLQTFPYLPLIRTLKAFQCRASFGVYPPSLISLTTHDGCDLSMHRSLTSLVVYNCTNDVECFTPLAGLTSLSLIFGLSAQNLSLASLQTLQNLETLELQYNITGANLQSLAVLSKLTS